MSEKKRSQHVLTELNLNIRIVLQRFKFHRERISAGSVPGDRPARSPSLIAGYSPNSTWLVNLAYNSEIAHIS